jgi:hypothetical protein
MSGPSSECCPGCCGQGYVGERRWWKRKVVCSICLGTGRWDPPYLLTLPPDERAEIAKRVLLDHGLTPEDVENLKKPRRA